MILFMCPSFAAITKAVTCGFKRSNPFPLGYIHAYSVSQLACDFLNNTVHSRTPSCQMA